MNGRVVERTLYRVCNDAHVRVTIQMQGQAWYHKCCEMLLVLLGPPSRSPSSTPSSSSELALL